MSDIRRFDSDMRVHRGLIHNGTVYLTGQVGTPGRENQMREAIDKMDSLMAKVGTDKTRPDVAQQRQRL
jgi:hypothetical protein